MTQDSSEGLPVQPDSGRQAAPPRVQLVTRIFLVVLGILLLGYMFLGRGFAHIGIGPIYIGDWVLLLGMAAAAFVLVRGGVRAPITWIVALLVAFAALGAARTIPYLGEYGLDALRDGVLWGYAGFALIVYLLVDRDVLLRALRLYGWVVPIFALWLPISWNLFAAASADIDPNRPGSFVPLVFFKSGDMAVHVVAVIAFLVLGASAVWSGRAFLWRMLICLPLLWTAFVAGTSNRGALVTTTVGIVVVVLLAPRWRSWLPLLGGLGLLAAAGIFQAVAAGFGAPGPSAGTEPTTTPSVFPTASLQVINGGFEAGPLYNGTIAGWQIRAAGPHSIVAGSAHEGARFASMENVAGRYEDTITSARFTFTGGPDIEVSLWGKAIAARPIVEIYVDWYDRSGTLISSVFVEKLKTEGVTSWQQCVGARTAPPNATHAAIKLYEASGLATVGIDDITVRSGNLIPEPIPPKGRPATIQQILDNLLSIFGSSSDGGLEGSKQFRLAWWGTIVDYTIFGEHFWTGKGFGVNLADDDGFQSTADHSLRSPHNSHVTVLARMGMPGLVLWLMLQGAFGVGLIRATLIHRRVGDARTAMLAGLILAYWVAMMVDTSFDPYLEGPQGGIWFWAVFGLGLVVIRIVPARRVPA